MAAVTAIPPSSFVPHQFPPKARPHPSKRPASAATANGRAMLTGVVYVPAAIGCFYPPTVDSSDILQVDFDCAALRYDGLYLVETTERDWRGCRRFQLDAEGWLMDYSGAGDWRRIESPEAIGLSVAGAVVEVFKPSLANRDGRGSRARRSQ